LQANTCSAARLPTEGIAEVFRSQMELELPAGSSERWRTKGIARWVLKHRN